MHVIGYMCSYITLLSLQPQNVWSLVGDHNSFTYNGELQRKSYSPICDMLLKPCFKKFTITIHTVS